MLVIKDKKKFIRGIVVLVIGIVTIVTLIWIIIASIISMFNKKDNKKESIKTSNTVKNIIQTPPTTENNISIPSTIDNTTQTSTIVENSILNEWNLKLVNKGNAVSRDYVPELEEYADGIMFDKRAISHLKNMINAIHKEKITGIWIASAYRSYEKQEQLFNNKVQYYKNQGKKQAEAEELAQKVVQRPEMSEHNLGLAVDFNTVSNEFEKTKAFEWLQKNASDYGFILRYPKDKQEVTKITYESWHWRYVGKEHAKVMKEKGYCLEEYIEYLKGVQEV